VARQGEAKSAGRSRLSNDNYDGRPYCRDCRAAPQALKTFSRTARKRMRIAGGGYRREHLRALAQRVEAIIRKNCAASKRKNGGFWRAQFCTEVARHSE